MFKLLESRTKRNALALEAKSLVENGERQLLERLKNVGDVLGDIGLSKLESEIDKVESKVEDVSDEIQDTINRAQAIVETRLQELEEEFNQTMDRVSGWYARQAKTRLLDLHTSGRIRGAPGNGPQKSG
jgi:hypothetical protein